MAFVPDSRTPGYLGPNPDPQPDTDDAYDNFLHDVIAGITGLPDDLIRPRWQMEPPNLPPYGVNWVAFGIIDTEVDFSPAVYHRDDGKSGGLGYDTLQEHQIDQVMCSFYGPRAGQFASYLRRGLYVWQNRFALRANAVGLVEVTALKRAPELIRQQWWNRIDLDVMLRREVRYEYNVRNLLRSYGTIAAMDPDSRIIESGWDTGEVAEVFVTYALREDGGLALREDGGRELRETDISKALREDGGLALREDGGEELRE